MTQNTIPTTAVLNAQPSDFADVDFVCDVPLAGTFRRIFRLLVVVACVSTGLLVNSVAVAQNREWINTSSGNDALWHIGGNWFLPGAPGPTDQATFSSSATYDVLWDEITQAITPSVGSIGVTGGDVTFHNVMPQSLTHTVNNDLTVTGSATSLTLSGLQFNVDGDTNIDGGAMLRIDGSHSAGSSLNVGGSTFVNGALNVEAGGVVNNTSGFIGDSFSGEGVANITGPGSQWNNSSGLTVGNFGNGTLNIQAGGVVSNTAGFIGNATTGSGVVTVTGPGSQWNNSSGLTVGNEGNGTLNVEAGGVVSNTQGIIGANSTGAGQATVSGPGSQWNNSASLSVGLRSNGTLIVEAGGVVSNTEGRIGFFDSTGVGVATVSGPGSQWNNSSAFFVGLSGNGTLNVEAGGVVSNTQGIIGANSTGAGQATVSGPGSQWNNSNILFVGNLGNGTLNVEAGGVVSNTIGLIGSDSTGVGVATVTGPGSQWNNSSGLTVGNLGNGTLKVEAGGVVSNTIGLIGLDSTGVGVATVTGPGSQWNNSSGLTVGNLGNGTLNVEAGGVVSNTASSIGNNETGVGVVTVTGAGSQWNNSGDLRVGNVGNGTLNVEAGGVVSNTIGLIGGNETGVGVATVTGPGSQWNNSSGLSVGTNGNGTLNVEAGGVVNNTSFGTIGSNSNGVGVATVIGPGSQWNNSNSLSVGANGNGTLNVEAGGVVSNTFFGTIGQGLNGVGVATVTGPGSQWNTSSSLNVGQNGNGTLNVEAGGVVSTTFFGIIGTNLTSTGVATVTGTGSQWNNSGDLLIAPAGTGTLNIADNGLVSVAGTTTIGTNGSVNLTGGRFEFGQTTLGEFSGINAVSGSMAGTINVGGINDVASFSSLQNPLVDLTDVNLTNSGLLVGSAILGSSLDNQANSELMTNAGQQVIFAGNLINTGEVNNSGGTVRFEKAVANNSGGFIGGRGVFGAGDGFENQGVMAFSGTTDILGDVNNLGGGQIVTSGGATTTIFDDLIHNGTEIRTSAGSNTVIFGEATGAGAYTGTGTVFFEGDLRPGNSPGVVLFEGDVVLGLGASSFFELGGQGLGDFDQMLVNGDLFLDGDLSVSLIDGFQLSFDDEFLIADVGGALFGQFSGLSEGDLVGNFGGRDLFISYSAGNGNDVALFTSVPEPGMAGILALVCLGLLLNRRPTRGRTGQMTPALDSSGSQTQIASSPVQLKRTPSLAPSTSEYHSRCQTIPLAAVAFALGLLAVSFAPPSASAQTTNWLGGTGNWFDASSWDNGFPSQSVQANIDNGNAINSDVLFNGTGPIGNLTIDTGDTLRIQHARVLSVEDGNNLFTNNGLIQFEGTGATRILVDRSGISAVDLTFAGNGTVRLTDNNHSISAIGEPTLVNGVDHTIEGLGKVGNTNMRTTNHGLLHGNVSGGSLTIDSGDSFINTGTVRASHGGTVNMFSQSNTGNGLYEATGAGSTVHFFGTSVSDATFNGTNGGLVFKNSSGTIDLHNVTNLGAFQAQSVGLSGSLTNQGRFTLVNGSNHNIELANDVHVTGGGTIDFSQGGTATTGGGKLFADDVTLEGFGRFETEVQFAQPSVFAPGTGSDATASFDFSQKVMIDGMMMIQLDGMDVNDAAPNINLVNTHTLASMNGLDFDQLNVFHSAIFGEDALLNVQLANGYIPEIGDFFDVLTADEFGFFDSLDSDLPVINGLTFSTETLNLFDSSTGTNRDVFRLTFGATAVPEPSSFALMGVLGIAFVLVRRRSRIRNRQSW